MKLFVIVIIAAVALFVGGCIGVDGQPLQSTFQQENAEFWAQVERRAAYDEGFQAGCMSLIFYTTTKQDRPPYDQALALCASIFEMAKNEAPAEPAAAPMPAEPPPVICTGQCI